jgi:hypothetical protein
MSGLSPHYLFDVLQRCPEGSIPILAFTAN